jgi:hypothetical protein
MNFVMASIKESDLFEPVKNWLEDIGYEVFAEVQAWSGRADIIGRRRPAIAAVELKTSLTMELVEQAVKWRHFCHYIYIAIPRRTKPVPKFINKILSENRIGILEVSRTGSVHTIQQARFNRPYQDVRNSRFNWDTILKEEHKTWLEGGSAGGGYVTGYKLMMNRIAAYLRRQKDWVTIDEILEHCETYYASPKSSLSQALRNFEYEWCELQVINRRLHVRVKPDGNLIMYTKE